MSTDIGRKVRARRLELLLSREELARRAGINPGYLETLETSFCYPGYETVFRLADALETTVPALLGSPDPHRRDPREPFARPPMPPVSG